MRVGTTFPRDGLSNDPAQMRDFAQAAEALGYDYISSGDHVIGRAGLEDSGRAVIDPLVLLSHLAAVTTKIGLVCGIMVLPQRQTVLVAKQAAGVDVLSGGRLQMNLAVGWNDLEYAALNENFSNRGRRMEEQVELMRALWTNEGVTYGGRYHHIDNAGINPLPVQRPIPIWMAGYAENALKRVARLADGWIPQTQRGAAGAEDRTMAQSIALLKGYVKDAGRDPETFPMVGSIGTANGSPEQWRAGVQEWLDLGATEFNAGTSRNAMPLAQHNEALRRFGESEVMRELKAK
jgi:probable F420-dependent oxidoreductase